MSEEEKDNRAGAQGMADLMGSDAGTKGTGSAGLQAGDAPDSGATSGDEPNAGYESGDAGTKGTGSAG